MMTERGRWQPAPTHLAADCEAFIAEAGGYCVATRYYRPRPGHQWPACEGCGEPMHQGRSDSRTCSPRCRQRVSRRTRKAAADG